MKNDRRAGVKGAEEAGLAGAQAQMGSAICQQAVVVFGGGVDLWWLKFLKPGFRHCFLALSDGCYWLTFDPMAHRTEIRVQPVHGAYDLGAWFESQGLTVARARIGPIAPRPAPWMPFSCVEAIKRVLGIRARRVMTPWRLYRYLTDGGGDGHGPEENQKKKRKNMIFFLDKGKL